MTVKSKRLRYDVMTQVGYTGHATALKDEAREVLGRTGLLQFQT